MTALELRDWMEKHGVTKVDIASALKIDPATVARFLKGKSVQRSTLAGFERFVSSHGNHQQQQSGGLKATGT